MRVVPAQRPGRSKQDYETPSDFIAAVERRFGPIAVDLAATADNAKAALYFGPKEDSLRTDWTTDASYCQGENVWPRYRLISSLDCWLNPPFGKIGPWAAKCAGSAPAFRDRGGRIFLLTPASVGAEWFAEHVHGRALVLALRPRLTFVGETDPYPKDCVLSVFGAQPGFELWRWRDAG